MNIDEFLNNFDRESARRLGNMANTPEGRQLINKLKTLDKSELLRRISAIDKTGASKEALIRQLANDPGLIKKLNNILDRK